MNKSIPIVLLVAVLGLALTSCSKEDSTVVHTPPAQTQAGIDPFKQVLENQNNFAPNPAVVLEKQEIQKSADPFKDFAESKK
jgi:hypothetical protein